MLRLFVALAVLALAILGVYLAWQWAAPPVIRGNPNAKPWERALGAVGIGLGAYTGGAKGASAATGLVDQVGWLGA